MIPTCARCDRPAHDGYTCRHCGVVKPGEQLQAIADMTTAARDIAHGLSRRGAGAAAGKPGSQLPLDLTTLAKLDGVQNQLTGWARHVAGERGLDVPATADHRDQIVLCADWLAVQLEWLRHRPEGPEFLADLGACERVVRGIARGPAAQKYLGPCRSLVGWDDQGTEVPRDEPCPGDVYGLIGAKDGACRKCGARWATGTRRAWLDGQVRSHAYRAAHIAEAYDISVDTIRSWATARAEIRDRAGKITQYARAARLTAHGRDREGRPLYLLGEVLDLAAADAARRVEAQARRARREAARTQTSPA